MLSQATKVRLPPTMASITQLAVGFEHVMILTGEPIGSVAPGEAAS